MLLLGLAKTKELGETSVDCRLLSGTDLPLFRCDVLNMTRHVHHHYDYAKDGHTRTYTMRVQEETTTSAEIFKFKGNFELFYHVRRVHILQ